jgi:RNA polymerase sigma-70 factor (ECF subfamily)
MEEHTSIQRLCRGDVDGLEFLVRQYQVRAVRTACLVTHERIHQLDARRPFAPWFLTIVLHDAVKAAKRRDRHQSLENIAEDDPGRASSLVLDGQPGPELLWEQAETTEEVRAALERLTPEQRAAVVARYFLGLSEAEMAETLDCPPSTVKWRLYAARQRLRLLLRPLVETAQRDRA